LLAAARAGTEVARRDLIVATKEAYYALALTAARLEFADRNVATVQEFERVTGLLAKGGEVPAIDLSRARLQTAIRLDEREQAKAAAAIASESLRFLTAFDANSTLAVERLETLRPLPGEIANISSGPPSLRPEFLQIEAQKRAVEEEAKIARADRRPSLLYTVSAGADTDSLQPSVLNRHVGGAAFVTLSIPVFDWGISRSKERQAQFRAQTLDVQRQYFERSVIQQVGSARALAVAAGERTQIASSAIAEAEHNVSTSIARYRGGEALILEVTDAQNLLTLQQQNLYQAIYEYRVGIARLELAAGVTK
jgi:outer membrane protein TolC